MKLLNVYAKLPQGQFSSEISLLADCHLDEARCAPGAGPAHQGAHRLQRR